MRFSAETCCPWGQQHGDANVSAWILRYLESCRHAPTSLSCHFWNSRNHSLRGIARPKAQGPERWTYLSWKETKCLCRSDCHAVSCCADCQRFVGTMVVKVAIDESSGSWLADCLFSFCHPIGGDVWLKLTAKHRTSRLTWQGPQIKCRANVDINDWFSNTYNIYRYTQSITV